jgi:hypothetical protein
MISSPVHVEVKQAKLNELRQLWKKRRATSPLLTANPIPPSHSPFPSSSESWRTKSYLEMEEMLRREAAELQQCAYNV